MMVSLVFNCTHIFINKYLIEKFLIVELGVLIEDPLITKASYVKKVKSDLTDVFRESVRSQKLINSWTWSKNISNYKIYCYVVC